MAIREIKATLALDGEKKFKAELDEASRSLRVMDTGLKAIEASYGVTGDKSAMLAKRSEVLKNELEQQKHIVSTLGNALKEADSKYGSTAKQTDGYRIKLNNALKKQAEMEKAIRDTERELDELGKESVSVGREIESGIGDAAEDAAKDLRNMYNELKGDIEGINVSAGISAVTDLGGTIKDAASGLMGFAESSREYRRQMSFLEQNAKDAGRDYETIKSLLFDVASLTGEVDGAVEGVSNLLAAGFDATEMVTAIELLKGAVIQFPDTMKFESLADSLQETVATGEATGQYAELLGRLGVDLETFKKAMDEAEGAEERQQVALSFLANNGLKETYDAYKGNNEELLKAEEVSLRFNDEMATLGGTLERLVATPIKGWGAEVASELNSAIEGLERWYKTGDWKQMFEGAGDPEADANAAEQMASAEAQAYYAELEKKMKEDGSWVDVQTAPVAEREKTRREEYAQIERDIAAAEAERAAMIEAAEAAEAAAAAEVQTAAKEEAKAAGTETADAFFEGYVESMDQYAAMYNQHEGLGMDWAAYFANENEMQQAGEDEVNAVKEGVEDAEPALSSAAETIGKNAAIAAGNGINTEAPYAISAAAALADGINTELSRIGMVSNLTAGLYDRVSTGTGSKSASASGSSAGSVVTVPLYMDSQKVGEAVIPSVSAGIGMQIKQAVTIG